ncbi:MAG TPA: hypothetical protein DCY15_00645, partial [Ruminococcaceae bacterium]|nr:hypothetical protein [Oscillospiraceae bacterium]
MDNKDRKDTLENMDEFNKKYNHYLSDDEETQVVPVPKIEKKDAFEDVSSYDEASEEIEEEPDDGTEKKENFFTKNKHKNTKIIALCLVIVLLLG